MSDILHGLSKCISLFTNKNQLNNIHGVVSKVTMNKNYIILYSESIWNYILLLSFFNIPYYSESHSAGSQHVPFVISNIFSMNILLLILVKAFYLQKIQNKQLILFWQINNKN